jgi:uncharacterized ion transporter superfamily protein YfcC
MGIYDRDYYRERTKEASKPRAFTFARWLIIFMFVLAFVVYILSILSEKG